MSPARRSVLRSRTARAGVVVLSVALAGCLGPPIPTPSGGSSDLIPCSAAGQDHVVVANAHLDPSCTYTGRFRITAGSVRFDCNGALVTGNGGTGIEVSTPAGVSNGGPPAPKPDFTIARLPAAPACAG